jgi:predicted nucleic acid-binding protein
VAVGRSQGVTPKHLVLDANILLRAVFGARVLWLLKQYEDVVVFYSPDECFEDARKYIPHLAARRGLDPSSGLLLLDELSRIVQAVDRSLYEAFEAQARARISSRDADDWPVVAASLLLDCPIWTEDRDFFGSGAATWTTGNIELYLRET